MPRKKSEQAEIAEKPPETTTEGKPVELPAKKKGVRSNTFSQHIADVICIRISEGESLRNIVKEDGMPDRATVYRWLLSNPSFCDQYTRAREEQADTLADEIIAIADEEPERVLTKTGDQIDSSFVQWQKLRMEARKWTAMKLKPKKYGERVTHAGDPEAPLQINSDAALLLAETVKNLELKRQNERGS